MNARNEMMKRTNEMQKSTDNHISWCASEVASKMTNQEITDYAAEVGKRMIISTAYRAITGINKRTGEQLSDKAKRQERSSVLNSIATYIQFDIRDN